MLGFATAQHPTDKDRIPVHGLVSLLLKATFAVHHCRHQPTMSCSHMEPEVKVLIIGLIKLINSMVGGEGGALSNIANGW